MVIFEDWCDHSQATIATSVFKEERKWLGLNMDLRSNLED